MSMTQWLSAVVIFVGLLIAAYGLFSKQSENVSVGMAMAGVACVVSLLAGGLA